MDLNQTLNERPRPQSFAASAPSDLPVVISADERSPHRESLEQYISGIFLAAYDARILEYLPLLFCLRQDNDYTAAFGLGSASASTLFSEQYLDVSVEDEVESHYGNRVARREIMELGNLVSSHPGQSPLLYLLAALALHEAGIGYLVFVANKAVRASIERSGFTPIAVADAQKERLGSRAQSWGSYYDGEPVVMLADIALSRRLAMAQPFLRKIIAAYEADISALADAIRGQIK